MIGNKNKNYFSLIMIMFLLNSYFYPIFKIIIITSFLALQQQ